MNIQFTAKTFTSTAALLADHAAVRRRLFNPGRRLDASLPEQSPSDPMVTVRRRLPRAKLHFHDAHVIAWNKWKASAGSPLRNYIQKRCEELGVPYLAVIGQSRKSKVVEVRHLLMWEIRTKVKPNISYPELGRIFGGKDHTSALSACRKMEARRLRADLSEEVAG